MTYGNRYLFLILILCLLLIGCSKSKDWYFELYDGYVIKAVDDTVKLYKNDEVFKINELDYKIDTFKYNSDVVCLKIDNSYYMIYYVDSSIYGPYTKETLDDTTNSLSMTFSSDFKDISEIEGIVYE